RVVGSRWIAGTGSHFLTFTWKPALWRAPTRSLASKSPVTSKVSDLGLAVSPVTPLTPLRASLIPLVQDRQQVWTPVRVRLVTFSWGRQLEGGKCTGLVWSEP